MTRSRFVFVVLIATLALGGACKKRSEQPAPPPQGTQTTPPPGNQPVTLVRLDLGNALNPDKSVAAASVSFKPNDTIYASIETAGSAPAATLAMRWTYENGQVVNESSQTIAPTGPTHTEFHISKPDGWPTGTYTASVSLNGAPLGSKSFQVKS
jgi:hypothetical protein